MADIVRSCFQSFLIATVASICGGCLSDAPNVGEQPLIVHSTEQQVVPVGGKAPELVDLSTPLTAILPKLASGDIQRPTFCACSKDGHYLVVATAGSITQIPGSKFIASDVPPVVSPSALFLLETTTFKVVRQVTIPRPVSAMVFVRDGAQLFVATSIEQTVSGVLEASSVNHFGDCAPEPYEVIGLDFPSMEIQSRLVAPGPLFDMKYAPDSDQLIVVGVDQNNIGVIASFRTSEIPDTWPAPRRELSDRGAFTELDISHAETYVLARRHHAGTNRISLVDWRYRPAYVLDSLELSILPNDVSIVSLSSGLYVNSIDQEDVPLKSGETGSESLEEFDTEGMPRLHTPDFRPVSLGDIRAERLIGMIGIEREGRRALLQLWDVDSRIRFALVPVPVQSMKRICIAPGRKCIFVVGDDEIHRLSFPKSI